MLDKVWLKNMNDTEHGKATIPRSVQFGPIGDSVLICGLESGIVYVYQKEKKHIEITLNFRAKRTLLVTEQFLGINLGYLNLETYKPLNISTVMK